MAAVLAAAVKPGKGRTPSLAEMEKRFGIGLREMMHLNRRLGVIEDVGATGQLGLQLQFDGGKVTAAGAERLSQLTRLSRVQAAFAAEALNAIHAEPATQQFCKDLAAKLNGSAGKVNDQLLIYRPSEVTALRAKLALLHDALRRQRSVAFEYRGPASKSAGRVGDPLSLRRDQGAWRVLCWDHLRKTLRTFSLEHMTKLVVTVTAFNWPDGLDPAVVKARDLSVYEPNGDEIAVRLRISPRMFEDWAKVFKKVGNPDKDGYCEVTLMAGSVGWLVRTFLPNCDEMKVLGPPDVKKAWETSINEVLVNALR